MANLNKVMLIGRLTRDPEIKMFSNGGKVAKIGFAVNNRRKNSQTGQWEDEPVFLDCEAFNRGEMGKQADLVEQGLRKGSQVFIEGHLRMDNWTSQDGQKRSKILVIIDNFQFLEPRGDGPRPLSSAPPAARRPSQSFSDSHDEQEAPLDPPPPGRTDEEIPF
jgi:single-strand DNA-binding protein